MGSIPATRIFPRDYSTKDLDPRDGKTNETETDRTREKEQRSEFRLILDFNVRGASSMENSPAMRKDDHSSRLSARTNRRSLRVFTEDPKNRFRTERGIHRAQVSR